VAVNLSPSEFHHPGFVEAALRDTGLDPHALELELSESIIFGSAPSTVAELRRLINLGTRLSIDDFGAAHSSLRWLLTFPVATLKIDQSFIRDILTDATGARVMKALIGLGHSLDLKVTAEGVETQGQREFLEANNCDEMQGFHIGGLLAADQVGPLLTSHEGVPDVARTPFSN
jgi:EAL domain-containing protein (putative c-di-GMP-specific phosphodiesterase class I)